MTAGSSINIKTPGELKILREAGSILASVVNELKCSLKSGVKTRDIDQKAEEIIKARKVVPAFKGYPPIRRLASLGKSSVMPSWGELRNCPIVTRCWSLLPPSVVLSISITAFWPVPPG